MTLAERDRVILRVNKKLAKQEGIVIMKTIGTDILSFSLRTTKHKIDIPERGNPFQCFLTKAREFWLSGKVLFGFSLAKFLSCKKAELELKLWQCDHRNQDFDNKPETHRKGSQSIDNLNCASRGDATGNRGLLGVMAGALITQVIRVPKSFIERHGQ